MSDIIARLDNASQPTTEPVDPTLQLGRFKSPSQESNLKSLASNLKDFLTERPVKIKGDRAPVFSMGGFGDDIGDNFKEFFRPSARGPVNSALLVNWDQNAGLWQNLRDMISPPQASSAQRHQQARRREGNLVQEHAVHARAIALHCLPRSCSGADHRSALAPIDVAGTTKANSKYDITTISPYLPKLAPAAKKAGGGGGRATLPSRAWAGSQVQLDAIFQAFGEAAH